MPLLCPFAKLVIDDGGVDGSVHLRSLAMQRIAAVGMAVRMPRRKLDGKPQHHDVCGIMMHSSLAHTLDGLPSGHNGYQGLVLRRPLPVKARV